MDLPPELFLILANLLDVEDTANFLGTSKTLARHFSSLLLPLRTSNNESILTGAVILKNRELVDVLLDSGADANIQDDLHGMSALHHAALVGDPIMVNLLLKAGANPNVTGTAGCTPLHIALTPAVIKSIADAGGEINKKNDDGATPIFWAASRGRHEEVTLMLQLGAEVDVKDTDGWTPLHCAAAKGFTEVVKTLMENGTDGNEADNASLTALHYASFRGHHETVKLLLENGVKVNATDGTNLTAICGAANAGHAEVVKILLEHKAKAGLADALFSAAVAGRDDVVGLLLENNDSSLAARVDHALRIAVERGHTTVVKQLLSQKIDIELTRPLLYAANNNHIEVVKTLLDSPYNFKKQAQSYLTLAPSTVNKDVSTLLETYIANTPDE